jgi:hypothetical protein
MGQHRSRSLLPALRLLETESQDEYDRLSNTITKSLKPRDALEEIWAADIIYFEWSILRLRRCEAAALNSALGDAAGTIASDLREKLKNLLPEKKNLLPENKKARVAILNVVAEHADDSAIEGLAIKTSAADLERLHRILASLEGRRDKALRRIAEYRGELGQQLRRSDGLIEGEVLELKQPDDRIDPKAA